MTAADLEDVLGIERMSYRFPWSLGVFQDCLRVGYRCVVGIRETEIIGYGIMAFGAGQCHILNICVRPDCRRCGYGRRLLLSLLDDAKKLAAEAVFLEVRQSNLEAMRLYRSSGFLQIGVRRNYYRGEHGREDAVVLKRHLTASGSDPS